MTKSLEEMFAEAFDAIGAEPEAPHDFEAFTSSLIAERGEADDARALQLFTKSFDALGEEPSIPDDFEESTARLITRQGHALARAQSDFSFPISASPKCRIYGQSDLSDFDEEHLRRMLESFIASMCPCLLGNLHSTTALRSLSAMEGWPEFMEPWVDNASPSTLFAILAIPQEGGIYIYDPNALAIAVKRRMMYLERLKSLLGVSPNGAVTDVQGTRRDFSNPVLGSGAAVRPVDTIPETEKLS